MLGYGVSLDLCGLFVVAFGPFNILQVPSGRVNFKIITRQKNEAVLSNLCGMHLQSDAADRLQLV